jgi:sulfur-oxidizing protein SoxY
MNNEMQITVLDRREFVLGASAIGLVAALSSGSAFAATEPMLDEAMKKVLGDAKPAEGLITLKLPEIAENGSAVPFTITVKSPMTKDDYVKEVHLFATGNPRPDIVGFKFTPASGEATATSRMRLGQTQDVVAIAQLSNGKYYMGKQTVKVTIGGCGG